MVGKILLVDDNYDSCRIISSFLESEKYAIDTVTDISKALELIERNHYNIVLIEENLLGIYEEYKGGLELLKHVRSQFLSSVVIMMTENTNAETAIKALNLGAFDYIAKQFSMEYLRTKINDILKRESADGKNSK